MLSVIVITKNEAGHIGRCLASVAWADEIVVLDSGSSDDTVAIARQFTDQVFVTDWPGFGPQKQRALDKASGDWILSLDADEEVGPALAEEIQQAIRQNAIQGFEIPRLSSYCGRPIKHSGWWPDYVLRLFRRDAGRFSNEVVHERVEVQGPIGRLNQPLLHEAFVDPEEVLHKINSYSTLGAEKLFKAGARASLGRAIAKGLWTFFRGYVLKAGFLDGPQGLMLAISNAEGTYYKYLKLRELHRLHR
ncbi:MULTISPECIES: glycosyltransferase family 2 protein [Methylomonas]|uniref:Glycosyl transferase family 2 n=1 Tax=Methylomonas koyamae TaxID=702114 RepID=A0A177PIB9_9GAMM|nr:MULTISPECIES: glycosyltransferase family 2 protein [Methylomonas]OAI29130.1 glycosyl transferase family 2 [Methylomonas koyamae]WGS86590.1 glycosyltransferase family 2 protein [Methylomonas sp. UP202]